MTWHISITRIAQAGARNLFRNAWLSTAATVVMTVTLTVMALSYVAHLTLDDTIRDIVNKIDVSIYLSEEATEKQAQSLGEQLKQVENVSKVEYVSKAEALKRFREQNKDDPKVLAGISDTDNPLPRSYAIEVLDQQKLDPVTDFVARPEVKSLLDKEKPTSYEGERKQTIDRIVKGSDFIRSFGLVASVVFVVISTLIIFNTIRMAIFTRKEEIEIMRLVGATNWFIRGPFLFEAAMYGMIAAVVATLIAYSIVTAPNQLLSRYLDMERVNELFRSSPHLILLAELGMGAIIGMGSSLLAMSRYLKLKTRD